MKAIPKPNPDLVSTIAHSVVTHIWYWVLGVVVIWLVYRKFPKAKKRYTKYIDSNGYVVLEELNEREHRYIAKKVLKRELNEDEVVHHINGDKKNNRLQNLCVMNEKKHEHFHGWLVWRKDKTGTYPPIEEQKYELVHEYKGTLLERVKSSWKPNYELVDKYDQEIYRHLYTKLKGARFRLAQKKNIPINHVFEDRTLVEMSEAAPENESEMLQIWGMGPVKFKMYGRYFLAVIRNFKKEYGLDQKKGEDAG